MASQKPTTTTEGQTNIASVLAVDRPLHQAGIGQDGANIVQFAIQNLNTDAANCQRPRPVLTGHRLVGRKDEEPLRVQKGAQEECVAAIEERLQRN